MGPADRPDFRFVLKLPRLVTHERRLAGGDEPLGALLSAIEPLGGVPTPSGSSCRRPSAPGAWTP